MSSSAQCSRNSRHEREQLRWYFQTERLGSLEIDDQLDLGGLHDRQVSRPLALENAACVESDLTVLLCQAGSIDHEAAGGRRKLLRCGISAGLMRASGEGRLVRTPAPGPACPFLPVWG
jgi:hypothetical protein